MHNHLTDNCVNQESLREGICYILGDTMMTIAAALTGAFGGMAAVANIVNAYQQYRLAHPRKVITGARNDYVKLHEGYNLCLELFQEQKTVAYKKKLLTPLSQGQPQKRFSMTSIKRR